MAYASITELLTDPRNKRTLDGIVDLTHDFLIDPDKETFMSDKGHKADPELVGQFAFFDQVAPVKLSDSFDVLEWQFKRNVSIASLIPTGGEIPSTRMGELIRIDGGYAKLALSHVFDEKTEIRMYKMSQANNMSKEFVNLLYGSVNDLQRKIMKLANVMCAQMLYQGRVNFVDPRSGVGIQIDYNGYPDLLPAPIDPAVSWDNYNAANGVQDLIDHCNVYWRINGFYPHEIRMSRQLMNHLLRQKSTAAYAESAGLIRTSGNAALPTRVTRGVLDKLITESRELPPIVEWDAQYSIEIAPDQTERARYIPDTHYVLVRKNMAKRLFSPTIESARYSSGNKPKPGIFLKVDETVKISPVQSRSFSVGRFFPHVSDQRLLAGRQVITSA